MDDAIAKQRETLLTHIPYVGSNYLGAQIEAALLAEVERDLLEHDTLEPEDGRIAGALGFYAYPSEQLRCFASQHAEQFIREELQRQRAFAWLDPEKQIASLLNGTTVNDLARALDPEYGWLIGICSLLFHAQSSVICDVVGTPFDASNVVLAYTMVTHVPPEFRQSIVERLLSSEDLFRNGTAVALSFEWIQGAIMADQLPDIEIVHIILRAPRPFRTDALGKLSARLVYWIEWRRLPIERYEVAVRALVEMVAALKASNDLRPRDIEATLEAAGNREACVLAAMSLWLAEAEDLPVTIAAAVRRAASTTLQRLFGSTMDCTVEESELKFFSLQPVLEALVTAFRTIGIESHLVSYLYGNLSTDRYSRDHRTDFWVRDRPRALALVAISAKVAQDRNDVDLMRTARQLVLHISSQPTSPMHSWALNFKDILSGIDLEIPAF